MAIASKELHTAIRRVRPALASKDLVAYQTFFLLREQRIHAQNGWARASTPCPIDGEFLVAGDEFERAVNRLPVDKLDIVQKPDDASIVVKGGRFRTTIQTLPAEDFVSEIPVGESVLLDPDEFHYALAQLRPFVSDNAVRAFSQCLNFTGGRAMATNNIVIVECQVNGLAPGVDCLLPHWAADFILGIQDVDLMDVAVTDTSASFTWEDGTSLTTALGAHPWPGRAAELLDGVDAAAVPVDEQWRSEVTALRDLGENDLAIYADRITVGRGRSRTELAVTSPVPEGRDHSKWSLEFTMPIFERATHINLVDWPKPMTFRWDRVKGLAAARS